MDTQHAFADVNGTRLYYEAAGSGDAVVLVHGFTLDTRMWDDQFLPLAQHFRVIRYDLRGFGKSALPSGEPYSHSDDLNALLDWLDIRSAHVVGLSKGGAIAIDFALTYPHRARSLALIDTVLGGFSWSAESSARAGLIFQRGREGGIPAAKESWLTHPYFAPAHEQPGVAARLARIIGEYSGWHFINQDTERGAEPPAAQRLHELRLPVLAIVGERDTPDLLAVSELVCREAPGARKVVVPGVGHMANMEAPAQVTDALLAFLTAV
jgi:pimeloyl-ACP methyl ester carboxylesterase